MNAMKKSMLTLAVLLASLTCAAQEHLAFSGIPIEGSMEEFCLKLEEKGFDEWEIYDNLTVLTGTFTGREATISVFSDDEGVNVHSVAVRFTPAVEWKTLVDTYNYYKELYTRKYGNPKKVAEESSKVEAGALNPVLMFELWQGRVTWTSQWETTGGDIELSVEKTNKACEGAVVIRYRDAQNEETRTQKYMEEI